jgi:DNA modification methylase
MTKKVYYLKIRANVALNGDIQLAEREIKALFSTYQFVYSDQIEEVKNHISLTETQIVSHTRKDITIGFIGYEPKIALDEIIKQLSFIQEIWFENQEEWDKLYAIRVGNYMCAVPFLAMSEFLTYSEKPNLSLVKQILSVISLQSTDTKLSKLICRANTSTPHVHGLHTYKAKFFPRFIRSLIVSETAQLNRKDKTILDPFVGSGTAVIEGALLGFQAKGVDIDKLSCLISQSKIDILQQSYSSIQRSVLSIYNQNRIINGQYVFPRSIARKFERNNIIEEQREHEQNITSWLEKVNYLKENKPIFQIAVSDALTRKFNIRMMGTGVGRFALEIQKTKLNTIVESNIKYSLQCSQVIEILRGIYNFTFQPPQIINGTATNTLLEEESIDFIITSPPYLPASSGREDYLVGKSISLTALAIMNENDMQLADVQSVGSMKNLNGERNGLPNSVYKLYDWLYQDELRHIKALPTLTYYQDIKKSLEDNYRILKKGAKAIYIIGKETIFYTSKTREVLYRVECDVIFKEIAQNVGFEILETIDIELDKKNKNARPRSLDKYYESAIILKKKTPSV